MTTPSQPAHRRRAAFAAEPVKRQLRRASPQRFARRRGDVGHPADTHDLIRVEGARVNNLKDVSVEIPKRRLTVTVTDANAMLPILFSRLGKPHIGPPTAYSFNVPTRKASGSMTVDKGKGERIVVRDIIVSAKRRSCKRG